VFSRPLRVEHKLSESLLVWSASFIIDPTSGKCDVVKLEETGHRLSKITNSTVVRSKAMWSEIDPVDDGHNHAHGHESKEMYITIYAPMLHSVIAEISSRCKTVKMPPPSPRRAPADTVKQLVNSGPPANRIDVVLMGDGYRASDETTMDQDMDRLTSDMFRGVTFSPYLPVFNVWSVFIPSVEQGIGAGGRPKNTAFGLYRDGTELRGVYCSKPTQARQACALTGPNACGFPSLIGNDPYYGGLGGEFTISTQSPTSGTIVLRHEMGHNFIDVGEEYDGGSAYFGVNHSPSRNGENVPWKHWLTEPENVQLEGSRIQVQEYAWYDLARGPFQTTFTSDGNSPRWMMRYSLSGCDTQNSVQITLDGRVIPWTTTGTLDRVITDYTSQVPLAAGTHILAFSQVTPPPTGNPIRQLCSVTLHEYRGEPAFHQSNDFIGAYPTWRLGKVLAGYRPSNERCLMRNMSSTIFCPVCFEGMWREFFSVIRIMDSLTVECDSNLAKISLETVKLGQLRSGGPLPGEHLEVRWFFRGSNLPQFDDQFLLNVDSENFSGNWEVRIQYITPLVRSDPNGLLQDTHSFQVPLCN